MVNLRKVRLMTQLSIYEKREGREDIRLSKYYKTDYARLQVLKTGIAVTIAFICILAVVILYKLEFLIENAIGLDYAGIGKQILAIYLAVMAVYLVVAYVGYSIKYTLSRKKLSKYFLMLRKLKKMYMIEDGLIEDDEEEEE